MINKIGNEVYSELVRTSTFCNFHILQGSYFSKYNDSLVVDVQSLFVRLCSVFILYKDYFLNKKELSEFDSGDIENLLSEYQKIEEIIYSWQKDNTRVEFSKLNFSNFDKLLIDIKYVEKESLLEETKKENDEVLRAWGIS